MTGLNQSGSTSGIQLVNTSPVPEPSTGAMMALGVGAMCLVVRRKRGTQHSTDFSGRRDLNAPAVEKPLTLRYQGLF